MELNNRKMKNHPPSPEIQIKIMGRFEGSQPVAEVLEYLHVQVSPISC